MRYPSFNNLLLFAVLLLTAACTADKDNKPQQELSNCRILEEIYSQAYTAGTRTYIYSGKQLIRIEEELGKGFNNLPHPNNTSNYLFESDAQGNITKVSYVAHTGDVTRYQTFEHNSQGLLIRINLFNNSVLPDGSLQPYRYNELAYNTQKQLVSYKTYDANSSAPYPLSDITYTYNTNGNVSSTRDHRVFYRSPDDFNDIVVNTAYTYDNKVNPYKENTFSKYLFQVSITPLLLSQNNVVTATSEATSEGTIKGPSPQLCFPCYRETTTYAYSYNDRNRPETVVNDRRSTISTFKYSCE